MYIATCYVYTYRPEIKLQITKTVNNTSLSLASYD